MKDLLRSWGVVIRTTQTMRQLTHDTTSVFVVGPWTVTAPRGRVADKRSSLVFDDLGNRGKVPQVPGTSQK